MRPLLLPIVALLLPLSASAQWVTFDEQTLGRLSLSTVPTNDPEEKDVATIDFDRNGWPDVIVVRKRPFSEQGPRTDLLLMNESGTLVDRTADLAPEFLTAPTDARDVAAADFTGDGWADVVIANTFHQQPEFYRNAGKDSTGTWLGLVRESSARFPVLAPPGQNPGPGPLFCGVAVGKVNNDNHLDIFFANYNPGGGATEDVLLINDGTGVFTDETSARLGTYARVAFGPGAEIVDVNDDGFSDIVKLSTLFDVSPWNDIGIFILFNDGTGVYTTQPFQQFPTQQEYMFMTGQLDDNPLIDFYVVQDSQDRVARTTSIASDGTLNLSLSSVSSSRTSGFGGNLGFSDIDDDGDLDVGVAPIDVDIANCDDPFAEFTLLRNNGLGNLTDPYSIDQNFHLRPHDFCFVDINQDGCDDIFMGLCTGYSVLVSEECLVTGAPLAAAAGGPLTLRADPNPSRGSTRLSLSFGLPESEILSLEIHDVSGRRVRTLFSGPAGEAPREIVWDARDDDGHRVAAGVFFATVAGVEQRDREKILILR